MFWNLDVLGLDVLGLDVLGLDVLGYHRIIDVFKFGGTLRRPLRDPG
jgi:hypothetical protein